MDRFWSKVDIKGDNECWEWIRFKDKAGYGQFGYQKKVYYAHRFSYELTFGQIANGLCVCHSCDNPSCCNPKHLWLGTDRDNQKDRHSKGRTVKGETHGNSLLKDKDVYLIKYSNIPAKILAKKFQISPYVVWSIRRNDSWRHI